MRVPADIITGFLGSGKTSLLRHVLRTGFAGQRVAVIVNDLADIAIDGRVVSADTLAPAETMIELDNGCICCSIDFRFAYAVQDLVDATQPDLVLIESTGVADPSILIDKLPDTPLALDAVVTVVDAENFERALEESHVASAQVVEADFLVVNKVDLVSPPALDSLERCLERMSSRALRLRATHGRVETPLLFGSSVRAYRQRAAQGRAHADSHGMECFTCEAPRPLRRDRFERFLGRLPLSLYRAKGIVRLAGESAPSLFNVTCGRVQLQWLPDDGMLVAGQGVFIGRDAGRYRGAVEEGFLSCQVDGYNCM